MSGIYTELSEALEAHRRALPGSLSGWRLAAFARLDKAIKNVLATAPKAEGWTTPGDF